MSEGTKIQWADDTHNFWRGCTKVSDGCKQCYAEARDKRFHGGAHWGKDAPRVRAKDFEAPLRWNRRPWCCDECGMPHAVPGFICMTPGCECETKHRRRVFSLSLGDFFDEEVADEWRIDALDVIRRCPNLDFLILTKRPGKALRFLKGLAWTGDGDGCWTTRASDDFRALRLLRNIWLGVSLENQQTADERIPQVLQIPAAVRFLSMEPLLGAVRLRGNWLLGIEPKIHWVIVGGESGPGARRCDVDWIRDVARQCKTAGVPCLVKQLGSRPMMPCQPDGTDGLAHLRHPKGGDPAEWPEDLRVREFPNVQRPTFNAQLATK